ncbi:hypothetical protein Y032_1124g3638 [Ancylostoma ceylanicum]|uniref:Uncharacterized protein n=1 Tax=Ancylostoma ceylanicum TaxID=53326 RepID=A0A016W7C2_9BILA|nr:hypothetical protein Y032_1124g3638 [Ancylostoma ceylanicum]
MCHLRGTVYLIKCRGCGQRYIGESGRPLRNGWMNTVEHSSAHKPTATTASPGTVRRYTPRIPSQTLKLCYTVTSKIRYQPEINNKEELVKALKLIA